MESELQVALQVIDDLATSTEGKNAILSAQELLQRQKNNKKHFSRVYAVTCAKIFQLTCDLPYQETSTLVNMARPEEFINTLCACVTSSRYGLSGGSCC